MMRGSLPALSEPKPRMRIVPVDEGSPDELTICTPGTAPAKASVTDVTWLRASSSAPTTLAEPVKADFLAVPKATTITSSRALESLVSRMRMFGRTDTSIGSMPM